ncbi:hypothetical protein DITRI_Ditri09bG0149600 [Diplodiscus trichospermus]
MWDFEESLFTSLFNNNNFHGAIPSQIGFLFRLKYLYLTENSLEGEIPASLSNCSELRVIHLNFNKLTGRIPEELSNLPKILALHISANNLTGGITPFLGNPSSLFNLSVARNNLRGSIPDELGRLERLKFLQVGSNNLSGNIPASIFNLSGITIFAMADNKLTGSIPRSLGNNFPNLQILAVGVNRFTGSMPSTLSNATGLAQIDFPDNYFLGKMPTDLGSIKNLQRLNVGRNRLGNGEADDLIFLNSLINRSKLQLLGIDNNHFEGLLPNIIGNFSTELKTLLIGHNQIYGSIPPGIVNLVNLNSLYMEENVISGTILIEIGKFSRLRQLFMNGNRLSSSIPPSIGNITKLFELRLDGNSLEGAIPSVLRNCMHLQLLNLSQNKLTGTIPKEVIGLASLSKSLNLARNSLNGTLAPEVGNLINLKEFDVSENRLSGNIPSTLGNCLNLEHLFMEDNLFEGNIPSSLSSLKGLQDLDLSRNNLSGQIPEFLQRFFFLQHLNLSSNNFEGEVPRQGVFANMSSTSLSGNSKLCGGILSLTLAPCPNQKSENGEKSFSLKLTIITVSAVFGFALLSTILILYVIKRSRKKPSSTSPMDDWHSEISYEDLHRATAGFSPLWLVFRGIFKDGRPIAVKVLNIQQKGATKVYLAECEALRTIRHRNLVKIIGCCSSLDFRGNNFRALLLQFMPNGNLDNWLHSEANVQDRKLKLDVFQRLIIAIDVASALEYLHHHCHTPIVHCDLKPSNVLLDADMCAHVSDFGLAKFLTKCTDMHSQNQTSSIGIRGSIGYVAPEYATGGAVSTHGDVYSCGIMLLEMFTGKRPTDDMFKDGTNLHCFAENGIPEKLMEILDPTLQLEEGEGGNGREKVEQCIVSILKIGVTCSAEQPRNRMNMTEASRSLQGIKDKFIDIRSHRNRQN